MENSTVNVATGALGPVLDKLTTLLGDEQQRSRLGVGTCSDIESIRSMLASLHALLLRIWERDDLGGECTEWMTEARALSYDMEDDIDDYMLGLERSNVDISHGVLNKLLRDLKMRLEAVPRRCRKEWKTAAPDEAISISNKSSKPSRADPRAGFLHKDASELVGMDKPFTELLQLLRSGHHEMVCIHGFAGTGKTTLADMVYQKIGNEFECRAFVSLSKTPDILEVLGAIFTQVTEGVQSVERTCTEATPEENLIHDISKFLSGKRYLVIVDDIWLWQSWENIRRALPKGKGHCRLITTTRVNAIAEKCCVTEEGATIYRHSGIDAHAAAELSWKTILEQNNEIPRMAYYRTRSIADMIADICGGTPLAIRCLSSAAVASKDWWKFFLYQDKKLKQQMFWQLLLDRLLCNNQELRPMVESLRLGYDDLPVHVKTCLLYCCIFPVGYLIERNGLVRKWIAQGFFPEGPEQEKEAAAEACLDELVSRGLLQQEKLRPSSTSYCTIHPMMRAFLLWKSKEANFATCFELPAYRIPASYASASMPFVGLDARRNTIPAQDGSRARCLVVAFSYYNFIDWYQFPWKDWKCVRVLSIEEAMGLPTTDDDLIVICSQMTRLRYLGLKGTKIRALPQEIGSLQILETLDVSQTDVGEVPKEIGELHHMKTLDVSNTSVRELPRDIGKLQHLETLDVSHTGVRELPRDIGNLQHLRILNVSNTSVTELPRDIRKVQQLRILNVSNTSVRELPRDIGKLQHLKTLDVSNSEVQELPWLSSSSVSVLVGDKAAVKLSDGVLAVIQAWNSHTISRSVLNPGKDLCIMLYDYQRRPLPVAGLKLGSRHMMGVPEWVKQHLAKDPSLDIRLCKLEEDDLEFLGTMPNLQLLALRLLYLPREPTVRAGTWFSRVETFCLDGHRGHIRVLGWVKQHLANVSSLDIRICQLVDDDLDFLRNKMPKLQLLTLRLEVLPTRKPIFIRGEGFLMLKSFCLDCRFPMVTFQQGAMPKLEHLEFKFYTIRPLTIENPLGISHLLSLKRVVFQSSPRYKSDAPGISVVINKVREEAKEHPNKITISINGKHEEVIQEKKKATVRSASPDRISEGNNVTSNGGAGGSSGASMIQTRPPIPYNTGTDDEKKGNIIPVKSYYPFGITD